MRIVLINWAPLWEGASYGGGVNGYVQALALELVRRGHDVTSLFGGLVYTSRGGADRVQGKGDTRGGVDAGPPGRERGAVAAPCLRRHDDWLGIRIFEVINSPVLAPSLSQFADPLGEVSQPELEGLLKEAFRHLRPEIVHFHNLEGFTAGCIAAAKQSGARVIYSLHNYHTLCSQVTLTRDHRWACHDFEDGRACATCIKGGVVDPREERRRRALDFEARHADSLAAKQAALQRELASFKHELSWPKRLLVKGARVWRTWREMRMAAASDACLPGRPVFEPRDFIRAQASATPGLAEHRGQAPALLAMREGPARRDPRDRPVLNIIQPQTAAPCTRSETPYALRRREMIRALSSCGHVLAVSTFVARKFESAGVPREKLTVMPIGSRINELIAHNRELVFDPPPFEPPPPSPRQNGSTRPRARASRPIRLVFLGYNHFNKGLPLLVDALERLDAPRLGMLDLSIFALGGETIEWRFRRLEPRLAKLHMTHGYQFNDIPWCLGGKDLTYVGSTWWDPAPQVVFESFACGVPVLGAELGGIPDFVHEGVNGLLFRGNDPADLARRLAQVIDAPWTLTRLRAGVRPPKDIAVHAADLERLYRGEASPTVPAAAAPPGRTATPTVHTIEPTRRNGQPALLEPGAP